MIALHGNLSGEFSIQKFLYAKEILDNQAESHRLAQPKAAYDFLSTIKEMVDDSLGEGEYQLPGLVQVFNVFTASGEFYPEGHYKQVIARVLFEDGITRTLRAFERFDIGDAQTPPGGEAGIDIIPDVDAPQQDT